MVCDPIGEYKAGSIVSTLRFGKILKERGHNVIFIGARTDKHKEHNHHHGVKTYRFRSVPIPKSGGWYTAFPTVKELKKVFQEEKIEVVHIILPMTAGVIAIKAARELGIKVVAHSHSQPENIFPDAPKFIQPALFYIWNTYLAWVYRKAESLIYPSDLAYSLLDKLSRKGQPSTIISNGINLEEYKVKSLGDFNERYGIPDGKIKLLYVGRLMPEKSVDTLIKALPHIIEKHKNVHLMLVGGGYQRQKLEKMAQTLGLAKHVTFLGMVSDEDKVLAYNAGDIFILPSLAELEGMVVLEAIACGKPIIISDAKMSASRFFVNGNGFLFKTEDHQHLAEQVSKLIADEELRKKLGMASLEMSKKYDIQHSVDMLEEVYYSSTEK